MIATDADGPAAYDGMGPAVLLFDHDGRIIMHLPEAAWPQVRAWHRDPAAKALLCRDLHTGVVCSVDRAAVAIAQLRTLVDVVQIEARARARGWSEDDA